MDSRQIEKTAADWLARRDSGSWSTADEEALAQWLAQATAHRVALIRLETVWQQADRLQALGAGVAAEEIPLPGQWRLSSFATPRQQTAGVETERKLSRGARWRFVAAAAIALVAVLAVAAYRLGYDPNSYRTAVGHTQAVPLADGSQITLNTDSRIHVAITESERRIDLERGEAFFDVAKDPARPFVVHAGDSRIVAVGTQFSVLRTGEDVRVVVTEGRVRVEKVSARKEHEPAVQLAAGGIARVAEAGVVVAERPLPEAERALSWRSGYMMLRDTALAEAVAEFNRYHERKLVIGDPAIAGIRIGGNLRLANLDAFVRVLEQGFPVRAIERDDQIVLLAR